MSSSNGSIIRRAQGLTPYQGVGRCWGEFKCMKCRCTWSSSNTWRDKAQKCTICREYIYPFRQDPRRLRLPRPPRPAPYAQRTPRPWGGPPSRPLGHNQADCEKCVELGFSCIKYTPPNLECKSCGTVWFSDTSAKEAECPVCGIDIPVRDHDPGESQFSCKCGKRWTSAFVSPDFFVDCRSCGREIRPTSTTTSSTASSGSTACGSAVSSTATTSATTCTTTSSNSNGEGSGSSASTCNSLENSTSSSATSSTAAVGMTPGENADAGVANGRVATTETANGGIPVIDLTLEVKKEEEDETDDLQVVLVVTNSSRPTPCTPC
ncbi:uncharacterized protein LOC135812177 [Sycon ciliatum]|uniref:uncharacterized protein LOC135812177 n=1 Tax=Sycon ciliatum TaxID=27933 RepID=UPI0031F69606